MRRRGFASLAVSCGGPGNTGVVKPDPGLVDAVPWLNGMLPDVKDGEVVIPATPAYPKIGAGLPDIGSQRTDCRPLAGLEFSTGWFDRFEPDPPTDPDQVGVAAGWSSYDDLTQYAFHTPGDATWYPMLKGVFGAAWGMPSDKIPGLRAVASPTSGRCTSAVVSFEMGRRCQPRLHRSGSWRPLPRSRLLSAGSNARCHDR